jgi:hypothetical protein
VPDLARLPGAVQGLQRFASAQQFQAAGVQQHDVQMIGPQTRQRPVHRRPQRLGLPLVRIRLPRRATLADQHVLVASMGDRLADRLFRPLIRSRRIDHIHAFVQQGVENPRNLLLLGLQNPDRGAAEPHHGYLVARAAKSSLLH